MRHNVKVHVTCPECAGKLVVEVSPGWPAVFSTPEKSMPAEPAEIVDTTGEHILPCSRANDDNDDLWYEIVMEALDEQDAAAQDAEAESRMERERERRDDWERFEPEPAPDPRDAYDWDDPKRSRL